MNVKELVEKISRANVAYYDNDAPEISDKEYDQLILELKKVDPNNAIFNTVGNPTFGQKFTHSTICGSLDKVHSTEEIIKKFNGKTVCIMPKIDGLSLINQYEGSKLKVSATRGNGLVGEIVTPNAKTISNLPTKLTPIIEHIEVRGECYISRSKFYGIMDQPGYDDRPTGFANPRNAAAGSLRQKDTEVSKTRNLQFLAYKVVNSASEYKTQHEALEALRSYGFDVVPHWELVVSKNSSDELQSIIDEIKATEFDFEIDGVVVMIDDLKDFEAMGNSRKNPNGACAYKYYTEKAMSTITDIEWSTSRTGRVVPVAIIEPTEISGTVVSRITLNNLEWIETRKLAIGDTIIFEKANEIIPKLVAIKIKGSNSDINQPTSCPSCGHELVRDGIDLVCENLMSCSAQFLKSIEYIIKTLEIKGIANKTIARLHECGIIKNVWDIFDVNASDLVSRAKMGKREAELIEKAVLSPAALKTTPAKLLKCLGIPYWGETLFTSMSTNGIDLIEFINCDDITKYEVELRHIPGIGENRINALFKEYPSRKILLKNLLQRLECMSTKQVESPISGKLFCITGTLSQHRNKIRDKILANGGVFKGSVTKDLDFLITGENCGSKKENAISMGITILTEAEFEAMLGSETSIVESDVQPELNDVAAGEAFDILEIL